MTTNSQSQSWPSLYNPRSELFNLVHQDPVQPNGKYLTDPGDVFRFTLYWTLIFYLPAFVVCGLFAFLNLTFPPAKKRATSRRIRTWAAQPTPRHSTSAYPMSLMASNQGGVEDPGHNYQSLRSDVGVPLLHDYPPSPQPYHHSSLTVPFSNEVPAWVTPRPTRKVNERRSRLTFALIVLFTFLVVGLIGAVVSSAIVGFVSAGLYTAGGFHMSTWVPFLWAAIHAFVAMLTVWPSVINLI
ncbi:integral membrane protein [Moniliophthora roreri MCA 2997]|uniref:Integral membrane protein n=1 Tax=Moniliophthora roreri (strain MCA 2997) TaxID=1381753 RepID=V2X108_MONRO|nr:integral membrane protein [Moniliophthora roreri MCA 2997]